MSNLIPSDGRISPLTFALDEVLYKSSIRDLRKFYFDHTKGYRKWILLSDYYFDDHAPNKVITFTVMPYVIDLMELQSEIKKYAPKDVKHTRTINEDFVKLIDSLPLLNFVYIFSQNKYFIWDDNDEMRTVLLDYLETIKEYITFWRATESDRTKRLDKLSKSINCLEYLVKRHRKSKLIAPLFFVSLLGGYVGSVIFREAELTHLSWLSDRDSVNEICHNAVRELFQITLVNITKRNIQFSFTRANSDSDEWYEELTRIPDYITGTVANFDFRENVFRKDKFSKLGSLYLRNNRQNTFLYRFKVDAERIRVQRMLII